MNPKQMVLELFADGKERTIDEVCMVLLGNYEPTDEAKDKWKKSRARSMMYREARKQGRIIRSVKRNTYKELTEAKELADERKRIIRRINKDMEQLDLVTRKMNQAEVPYQVNMLDMEVNHEQQNIKSANRYVTTASEQPAKTGTE